MESETIEEQLIAKMQNGDDEALAELLHMHYSFLYKYVLKMTMDTVTTEEIVQDTMLKAYLHRKQFNGISKFTTWLITIATRTYVDLLRKKKRDRWLFKKAAKESNQLLKWQVENNNQQFDEVMEIIQKLDAKYRIPLLLKHYYGFSYEEIGEMMFIKDGTVKSRVHKSLTLVRKEINKYEG
ncbi:RNA polymerase sigma factor SigY [Peribacillus faecalis]|nr:RNA polymerase sigma factor SigY [Peribacillus faecalis]